MHPQHSYTQFRLVSGQALKAQGQPRSKRLIQQTWIWMKNKLFHSSDIKVWYTCDIKGTRLWSAHNPITRHTIHGVSDSEIRRWVEQCHRTHLRY
ncbi:MAG: hypothetical protein AAF921_28925 [Cyanobacteria bacterium P01_D01_bin.44]